jgi:mRNA-degrading endonuclease RelE of RelBE toxin-antitoxin system
LPRLRLKTPAEEAFDALPEGALDAVDLALLKIQADPMENGTPLRGRLHGKWKRNAGGYRIIYRIAEGGQLVIVESIRKRGEAYPRASR